MPGGKNVRPPAVFLHDADVLPGRVGALERLNDVLEIDVPRHPGFGSDDHLAEAWDSVGDLAQFHIERIRKRADVEKVHLMGAGFGGWVALEMAVRARELFRSLLLVSPYGVKVLDRTDPEFVDVFVLEPEELIELGWCDRTHFTGVRIPGYPEGSDTADDERAFADRAALARYGWRPFMHDPRLSRWIEKIDIPVLIIGGAQDRMLAPRHDELLADRIPTARFVELAASGHYSYIESPDAFADVVLGFLRQHKYL
ncbi:MAG TPA: alpha/beta hydrolase [Acidimicrobiales bacterium]|nr:alpha/beta hydrolase [Acidimicrobiales bacterium]